MAPLTVMHPAQRAENLCARRHSRLFQSRNLDNYPTYWFRRKNCRSGNMPGQTKKRLAAVALRGANRTPVSYKRCTPSCGISFLNYWNDCVNSYFNKILGIGEREEIRISTFQAVWSGPIRN